MDELHGHGDVIDLAAQEASDPVEWAWRELQVVVNPHDGMQTAFIEGLRRASVAELRVIACTYEGLDRIAGSQRQAELSWKAAASSAALARRTAATASDVTV